MHLLKCLDLVRENESHLFFLYYEGRMNSYAGKYISGGFYNHHSKVRGHFQTVEKKISGNEYYTSCLVFNSRAWRFSLTEPLRAVGVLHLKKLSSLFCAVFKHLCYYRYRHSGRLCLLNMLNYI